MIAICTTKMLLTAKTSRHEAVPHDKVSVGSKIMIHDKDSDNVRRKMQASDTHDDVHAPMTKPTFANRSNAGLAMATAPMAMDAHDNDATLRSVFARDGNPR
jgi:hypothetical protein